MKVQKYLDELEDQNWHSLYMLVELQQGLLTGEAKEKAANAMECAIAYLHWANGYYGPNATLEEAVKDRLEMN